MLSRFYIAAVLYSSGLLVYFAWAAARAMPTEQSASTYAEESSQGRSSKEQQTTGQKDSPATTLRVTTRLVQVNVVVTDKHGNPISGLNKEDFILLDNKQPQEIKLFYAEMSLSPDHLASPLAADTYSNRLSDHANVPANVTVILLDALNTEFADQALTRKQVLRFLEQVRPQDRIALYWLGNNLYSLHEFTADVASLREALAHSTPESSRDLAESNPDYLTPNDPNPSIPAGLSGSQTSSRAAFRSAFDQRVANESGKNRVRLTTAALIAIAHHVGSLRGRKNLVWVSGGFPFSLGQEKFDLNWANDTGGGSFSGDIAHAAEALTEAGVAVYPVDARGLMGNGVTAAGDFSAPPPPEFSGEGNEHLPSRVTPGNLETMKTLAERTGGKAFYGSNNLSEAIRRAIDDSRVSYTLGFYPTNTKWDGSFHSIKVRAKAARLEVRARTGYFALPDLARLPPKSIQAIISQTAISQLDATAIGLRVYVESANAPGERALTISLHLDLHDIHMEQIKDLWTSSLQTVFLELNNRGEIIKALDETLQLTLPQPVYEQALKDGLRNTKLLRILPEAAQLCVVLRDPANGNLGSVSILLTKYLPATVAPRDPR